MCCAQGGGRGRFGCGRLAVAQVSPHPDDATLEAIHLDFMVIVMDIGVSSEQGAWAGAGFECQGQTDLVYRYQPHRLCEKWTIMRTLNLLTQRNLHFISFTCFEH